MKKVYEIIDSERSWVVASSESQALNEYAMTCADCQDAEQLEYVYGTPEVRLLPDGELISVLDESGVTTEASAEFWAQNEVGVFCSTGWL